MRCRNKEYVVVIQNYCHPVPHVATSVIQEYILAQTMVNDRVRYMTVLAASGSLFME